MSMPGQAWHQLAANGLAPHTYIYVYMHTCQQSPEVHHDPAASAVRRHSTETACRRACGPQGCGSALQAQRPAPARAGPSGSRRRLPQLNWMQAKVLNEA